MAKARVRRGSGDGSVFQRASDGRWVGVVDLGYQDGKRKRKTIYGITRKAVTDQVRVLQQQRDQGITLATEKQTLTQFAEQWLETVVKGHVRPNTYQTYCSMLRLHILPTLGHIQLTKLTAQQVQALLYRKQTELSTSSIRLLRTTLGTMLTQAVRWQLLPRNVATLTVPPQDQRRTTRLFLSPDQARALLQAAQGTRLEALYRVALGLGLRRGEVLGLLWQDVDLERGTLHVNQQLQRVPGQGLVLVPPKTESSRRTLPLPTTLSDALREHRARQLQERLIMGSSWQEHGLVFTTTHGTPLYLDAIGLDMPALLKRAGLPPMRFHDLRHSCASLLAVQGVPARVAMEIMGHSNIAMTQNIYTHVLEESTRAGVDGRLVGRERRLV
jgi:integrase